MRVFVTGASGFIGSPLTQILLQAGCQVLALVSPRHHHWQPESIPERVANGQLTVLYGRLADLPSLRPALADFQPEACIHLAWYTAPGKYSDGVENLHNLNDSLHLLEELIQLKCRQIVMVGTCAEYDVKAGYCREDSPIQMQPATLYTATKLSLYFSAQRIAATAGINFAWARPFYLYGPAENEQRLVPGLIKSLMQGEEFPITPGEQIRDYLHVEDVAAALWTLANQQADGIFNVCSGFPITIRQFAETVGELLSSGHLIKFGALPYRDWEAMFICGDNQKLRRLGWSPRYALRDGLQHTVEWWRKTLAAH